MAMRSLLSRVQVLRLKQLENKEALRGENTGLNIIKHGSTLTC